MDDGAIRERGRAMRESLLGDAATDLTREFANTSPEFANILEEVLLGRVWSRTEIDVELKILSTFVALVSTGRLDYARKHIESGRRRGIPLSTYCEVLLQISLYIGIPLAREAFSAVADVYGVERGA